MEPTIYTPTGSYTLENVESAQIRLGVQGFMGTSKTWFALTFPNPVLANIDRGAGAHLGRKDVIEVPFYSEAFCKTINKQYKGNADFKDTFLNWVKKEAPKLTKDQTLVVDGLSDLETFFHLWYNENPVFSSRTGKEDDFAVWGLKADYFTELTAELKKLSCHVVLCTHESPLSDSKGEASGKVRPLISGKMKDKLGGNFTDWIRSQAADKPKEYILKDGKVGQFTLSFWGMKTVEEFKAMCDTFPRNTIYFLQLESDDVFDGKVSSLKNFPRFIPATYTAFMKYSKHKI